MRPPTRRRLATLIRVGLRYRLDLCLPLSLTPADTERTLFTQLLWLLRAVLPTPQQSNGERLRDALLYLGPVYIKFGQLLSTRLDLLDEETATALASLQDDVAPLENFDIHEFVSNNLDSPWQDHFQEIASQPLAAASIAQVHAATDKQGNELVIKVVRPGIRRQIPHLAWRMRKRHLRQRSRSLHVRL